MFMDYRPQQPNEHDFTYAARILRAASVNFEAMLANGSYSLADLREMKSRLLTLVSQKIDPELRP